MATTRRGVLAGGGAALLAGRAGAIATTATAYDVAVVGAGVFGAWTAERLRAAGKRVLLLDAWGPAHARASSGGESRMTRGAYGTDDIYTRMAWDSLRDWRALSATADLPLLHQTGVLFFFARPEPYALASLAAHRRLGLPTQALDGAALRRRWPQIDFAGIELGLFEARFGALMARRAVQTLVARFVAGGGIYRQSAVAPPATDATRLEAVTLASGERVRAAQFVFACGPWLPKVFPDLLGSRIFPTRQEVFFFRADAGDARFGPAALPGWADFNDGDIWYGFPDLEGRGFKIAHDAHGVAMDPDRGDRLASAQALGDARAYLARRFPALAAAPLSEARVCQYENSANGDLLVDRHPVMTNVLLVGAGSGHGFKHGPAVGTLAADLLTGRRAATEPRFTLASKGTREARAVH